MPPPPPLLVEATETTSAGVLKLSLDHAVSCRKIGLAHLVVRGAPIPFLPEDELQLYVLVTCSADEVEALMIGKPCDMKVSAYPLQLEKKEYLHIRDLLANLTQSYPRLDFVYDDTNVQQNDSVTITCLWDKQLAMLVGPAYLANRFGAPKYDIKMADAVPSTAVGDSPHGVVTYHPLTGEYLGVPLSVDQWLMSCIPEKVVHLRPYPAMPAAVKLLLLNTSRFNQVVPDAAGVDKQEFVIATLPPPDQSGYAVFNSRSDMRWLPLGGRRRDFYLPCGGQMVRR